MEAATVECPECSALCETNAHACHSCGLVLSSAHAVGAMNTAVQGSAEAVEAASSSSLMIAGPEARVGKVMGSYRLLQVLGIGGMGAVYLAEHVKLGRKVAIKMLHPHYADTPQVVHRFFSEARAVNRIFHDHIVEITDFVENDSGANYFIMEYLKGLPLGELLEKQGAMPLARSIGIIVQVCSALSAVHEAGIVHRDLKPDNIFITEKGGQKDYVKILDFGIAKLLDNEGKTINLQTTAAGMIMGTPEYMSPEQARGKPIDYRTDIYSVGVILYELATGRKPFLCDTFGEMVVAHSTEPPPPPSKLPNLFQAIPRSLEDLILHCLEKEPQKRPQTTKEIEDQLRDIARVHACSLEQFDVSSPVISRKSKRWLIAAVAAAAIAAAVAIPLMSGDSEPKANVTETEAPKPEPKPEPKPIPAVAPEPKPPEKVSVVIQSVPPGATVSDAAGEPLGTTPLTMKIDRAFEEVAFEIKLDGYRAITQQVSARADSQIAVVLTKQTRAEVRRERRERKRNKKKRHKDQATASTGSKDKKKKKKQGLKDGAVMNPFD